MGVDNEGTVWTEGVRTLVSPDVEYGIEVVGMIEITQARTHAHGISVVQVARVMYVIAVMAFVGCVLLQVYFAGLAVLVNPVYWVQHVTFAHEIVWVFPPMLAFGLIGRVPGRTVAAIVLAFGLYVLQFLLIYLPGKLGLLALRGLHPVNALMLFWLSVTLVRGAWQRARA